MDVTVREAKSQLSRSLKLAETGEVVTIVRRGIPVARLTPLPRPGGRCLGWDSGPVVESELRAMTDEEADQFFKGK